MNQFLTFLKLELKCHLRSRSSIFLTLSFFLLISILFPFAMGVDESASVAVASGAIWIAFLLAVFLSMPSLFKDDMQQGVVEQWMLQPTTLEWLVFAKFIALWVALALPLLLSVPLAGTLLQWPWESANPLILALFLGSVALVNLGVVGGALLARSGQNLLMVLLILPLALPVLIFGVMASTHATIHSAEMQIMLGLCLFFIALAPISAAAILRLQTR